MIYGTEPLGYSGMKIIDQGFIKTLFFRLSNGENFKIRSRNEKLFVIGQTYPKWITMHIKIKSYFRNVKGKTVKPPMSHYQQPITAVSRSGLLGG